MVKHYAITCMLPINQGFQVWVWVRIELKVLWIFQTQQSEKDEHMGLAHLGIQEWIQAHVHMSGIEV